MSRLHTLHSLASLGTNIWQKCLVASSYVYYFIKEKIVLLPSVPIAVRIKANNGPLMISISSVSDYWAMKDVFVDGEYNVDFGFEPKVIVDLGANVGISALFFASRYPHAQIYAFEPHPQTYKKLLQNVSGVPSIHAYSWAVSDLRGKRTIYGSEHSTHSSLLVEEGKGFEIESIVPDDLFSFLNISSIDIMKFDIEGAEKCLFRNFARFADVKSYIGEMHYDLLDFSPEDVRKTAQGYEHAETFKKQDKKRSILFLKKKC